MLKKRRQFTEKGGVSLAKGDTNKSHNIYRLDEEQAINDTDRHFILIQ